MKIINVACNIDNHYVKYCVVMLTSLFENNKENKITVHLLGLNLNSDDRSLLLRITDKYQQNMNFYEINDDLLKNCPINVKSHISIATYCRIFLPEILPLSIEKILYLDCDLLVRKTLNELWSIDISAYGIACVEDMWSERLSNYDRLKYEKHYGYFNAGVLLINLAYWRKHHIQKKALDFIHKYADRLKYYDQDVLNALLHESKYLISPKWNMQDGFYRTKRWISKETSLIVDETIRDPYILHYTGRKKPWSAKCLHPLKKEYFKYLDMTSWKGERPKKKVLFYCIVLINRYLCFLKLQKPKYKKVTY